MNSKLKHTPGPWRWHCTDIFPRGNPDFKRWHLFSASSLNADMVLAPNGEPQKFELVVSEADADLIYRAWEIPELEARIKELRNALEKAINILGCTHTVGTHKAFKDLVAALAKEKGYEE